jgi:hypothetical protein
MHQCNRHIRVRYQDREMFVESWFSDWVVRHDVNENAQGHAIREMRAKLEDMIAELVRKIFEEHADWVEAQAY